MNSVGNQKKIKVLDYMICTPSLCQAGFVCFQISLSVGSQYDKKMFVTISTLSAEIGDGNVQSRIEAVTGSYE